MAEYKKQNKLEAQPATATYNFVPLNSEVLTSEVEYPLVAEGCEKALIENYKNHVLATENMSGYFDITLTSLTPFIVEDREHFFEGKLGKKCIPGSSLRGCLKNIYKIITCSSYGKQDNPDFTDKQLEHEYMDKVAKRMRKELYSKTIAEHVPEALKQEECVDLTEAVFGMPGLWGSRVFFEDLYWDNPSDKVINPAEAQTMLSPNAAACRMYLEPEADGKKATYDGDTNLRGYKLYWHNDCDWHQHKAGKNDNIKKNLAPLPANSIFKGRIRFENLSPVELGALCALFNLPQLAKENEAGWECRDICYKLGMGKAIGLGTVSLVGELYLENKDYFEELFTAKGFNGLSKCKNYNPYIQAFRQYVEANAGDMLEEYESRLESLLMIMSVKYMGSKAIKEIVKPLPNGAKKNPLPHISDLFKKLEGE